MIENEDLATGGTDPERPTPGIGAIDAVEHSVTNAGTGGLIGAGAGDEYQGEIVSPREFRSGGTAAAFHGETERITPEDVPAYDAGLADAGTAVGDGLARDDDASGLTV